MRRRTLGGIGAAWLLAGCGTAAGPAGVDAGAVGPSDLSPADAASADAPPDAQPIGARGPGPDATPDAAAPDAAPDVSLPPYDLTLVTPEGPQHGPVAVEALPGPGTVRVRFGVGPRVVEDTAPPYAVQVSAALDGQGPVPVLATAEREDGATAQAEGTVWIDVMPPVIIGALPVDGQRVNPPWTVTVALLATDATAVSGTAALAGAPPVPLDPDLQATVTLPDASVLPVARTVGWSLSDAAGNTTTGEAGVLQSRDRWSLTTPVGSGLAVLPLGAGTLVDFGKKIVRLDAAGNVTWTALAPGGGPFVRMEPSGSGIVALVGGIDHLGLRALRLSEAGVVSCELPAEGGLRFAERVDGAWVGVASGISAPDRIARIDCDDTTLAELPQRSNALAFDATGDGIAVAVQSADGVAVHRLSGDGVGLWAAPVAAPLVPTAVYVAPGARAYVLAVNGASPPKLLGLDGLGEWDLMTPGERLVDVRRTPGALLVRTEADDGTSRIRRVEPDGQVAWTAEVGAPITAWTDGLVATASALTRLAPDGTPDGVWTLPVPGAIGVAEAAEDTGAWVLSSAGEAGTVTLHRLSPAFGELWRETAQGESLPATLVPTATGALSIRTLLAPTVPTACIHASVGP